LIALCYIQICLGIIEWALRQALQINWFGYVNICLFGMIGLLIELRYRKMRAEEDPF